MGKLYMNMWWPCTTPVWLGRTLIWWRPILCVRVCLWSSMPFLFLLTIFTFNMLEILHMWVKFHIFDYNTWWLNLLIPYDFGKEWNSSCFVCKSTLITRGFVGLSPRVPHGCVLTSGRMGWSCDELSRPNTTSLHHFI